MVHRARPSLCVSRSGTVSPRRLTLPTDQPSLSLLLRDSRDISPESGIGSPDRISLHLSIQPPNPDDPDSPNQQSYTHSIDKKMMRLLVLFTVLSIGANAGPVRDSPVIVTVETDSSKSLHLGPYDRTRFDLVETFHPLQTASVARADQVAEANQRAIAQGVKSVTEEGQIQVQPREGEALIAAPAAQRVVFGEWSEWTAWTGCHQGERSRLRSCGSKRPALRIVCHGEAKEIQKCFSSSEHHTAVANDPWTIEREISGDFKI